MCSVNTLIWHESAKEVSSGLVDFQLDDCAVNSSRLYRRKRSSTELLGKPVIEVELGAQNAANLTFITSNFSDGNKLVYHHLNLSEAAQAITITAYPLNYKSKLEVFVNVDEKANHSSFIWSQIFSFTNWSTSDDDNSSFIFIGAYNLTNATFLSIAVGDPSNDKL